MHLASRNCVYNFAGSLHKPSMSDDLLSYQGIPMSLAIVYIYLAGTHTNTQYKYVHISPQLHI